MCLTSKCFKISFFNSLERTVANSEETSPQSIVIAGSPSKRMWFYSYDVTRWARVLIFDFTYTESNFQAECSLKKPVM